MFGLELLAVVIRLALECYNVPETGLGAKIEACFKTDVYARKVDTCYDTRDEFVRTTLVQAHLEFVTSPTDGNMKDFLVAAFQSSHALHSVNLRFELMHKHSPRRDVRELSQYLTEEPDCCSEYFDRTFKDLCSEMSSEMSSGAQDKLDSFIKQVNTDVHFKNMSIQIAELAELIEKNIQITLADLNRLQTARADLNRLQITLADLNRLQTARADLNRLQTALADSKRLQTALADSDSLPTALDDSKRLQTALDDLKSLQTALVDIERLSGILDD
jgi:hypothetical protein